MPKLPRTSGKRCIKALEKMGFKSVRERGSHVVMKRETSGCVVPLHKEIKPGALAGILKQAGVRTEDFINIL